MYMESTGRQPGDVARLVSPQLPSDNLKCLIFDYNVHGRHIGDLSVLDQDSQELWKHRKGVSGEICKLLNIISDLYELVVSYNLLIAAEYVPPVNWLQAELTLADRVRLFVMQATRGGRNEYHAISDICADNFLLELGECTGERTHLSVKLPK